MDPLVISIDRLLRYKITSSIGRLVNRVSKIFLAYKFCYNLFGQFQKKEIKLRKEFKKERKAKLILFALIRTR